MSLPRRMFHLLNTLNNVKISLQMNSVIKKESQEKKQLKRFGAKVSQKFQ